MKKWIFLLFISVGFGALPPLAQGIREVEAILKDPRFYQSLGSAEVLEEIIRIDSGYLILTQNYSMQVDLKYGGGDVRKVGPIHFEMDFNPPVSLETGGLKK